MHTHTKTLILTWHCLRQQIRVYMRMGCFVFVCCMFLFECFVCICVAVGVLVFCLSMPHMLYSRLFFFWSFMHEALYISCTRTWLLAKRSLCVQSWTQTRGRTEHAHKQNKHSYAHTHLARLPAERSIAEEHMHTHTQTTLIYYSPLAFSSS